MEFFDSHDHFVRRFSLGHNAQVVFHGQDFRDAGTEYCLVISQNDLQHYLLPLLRMNLYWSITHATPFLAFLPLPFLPLPSLRTIRPVQCTSTSLAVPSTLAGRVISNSIGEPTGRSVFAWM